MSRLFLGLLVALVVALSAASGSPAAAPQRIVSLSPTATESLFAIGAGKQVIAVDDQSDYPATAPRTSLSGFTPNVEAIAGYKPDLVVVAYDPNGLVAAARARHPRRRAGRRQDARRGVRADPAARLADRPRAASGRGRRQDADADRRAAGEEHAPGPRSHRLPRARARSLLGHVEDLHRPDLLEVRPEEHRRRGRHGRDGLPEAVPEYVVSQSPDIVVLADIRCCGQSPKTVAGRPGWSRVSAVKTGTIVRIDDSIASRWGPRIVDFVRAVAAALAHLRR